MLRTGIGRAARAPSQCTIYIGADAARIVQEQNELNAKRAGYDVRMLFRASDRSFTVASFQHGAYVCESPRFDRGEDAAHWQLAYLHGVARSVAPARAHA